MWLQFFSQNAHFAIMLFAALVSFAVCWLYVDAWTNKHEFKELLKWLGFGFIGLSFLLEATLIEQAVLGKSILGDFGAATFSTLRVIGYILAILGQIADPLMPKPKLKGLVLEEDKVDEKVETGVEPEEKPTESDPSESQIFHPDKNNGSTPTAASGIGAGLSTASGLALPIGALALAVLYWRRATTGLERHLKPIAYSFALLFVSELLYLARLLRGTENPLLYNWVKPYGAVWWLQHIFLLAGCIVLGMWVWGYLTKRFFSQLFMIFTSTAVIIFLVVSVAFTSLLLQNIRKTSLHNLETAANVLDYALNAKQSETTAFAQQLANLPTVVNDLSAKSRDNLVKTVNSSMLDKKLTNIVVTNQSGQVLVKGKDAESWGDSMSEDPLIKRALIGISQSSVVLRDAVSGQAIEVRSAQPVRNASGAIVGVVMTSVDLGSSFVDGLKTKTGLDSSLYAQNTLAATTFVGPDGKTRDIGVKLNNEKVKQTVLEGGKNYTAPVNLQNRQMLSAFLPLKDVDNGTVGMILVAQPESNVLKTAGRSVELTFLLTAALLVASIVPIYFVSNGLVKQID